MGACGVEGFMLPPLTTTLTIQTVAAVLAITALPTVLFSQAVSPGAAIPAPAEKALAATEVSTPLTGDEKKFLKDASEGTYLQLSLVEIALRRNRPVGASVDRAKQIGD